MFTLVALYVLVCAFFSSVTADVLHLNENEFAMLMDRSTNLLVEFYAPWCGHCKSLAPEWKIAGETFTENDDIKIIAIDATQAPKLSDDYQIEGFPTIKFFPKGSVEPEDYEGGRTADDIVKWVNDKIGTSRKLKTVPSSVVVLGSGNFDKIKGKSALVEFYAPWCGHCKSLAPKYEEVAKIFAGEKSVVVAKVDATVEPSLAERFEVKGYPTLKWFPAGSDTPVDYEGGREVDDMVQFINEKAGTKRSSDGSLLEDAGRVKALDDIIAAASKKIDESVVASLKAASQSLSGYEIAASKTYIFVAEKIVAKGGDYAAKESARLLSMISNPSVSAESKTNFMLKYNIIAAFK